MKAEIAEARREVRRYEARYGMSLARFEAEVLAAADSFQAHEDDNDWFYWQSVLEEKQRDLAALQGLRPSMIEGAAARCHVADRKRFE